MRPEERRRKIVALVREHRRVSVEFLSDFLDLSRETIRRDLTDLAARGELVKYHGGAGMSDRGGEGTFEARLRENFAEKQAIARRAAVLFSPGDSLFIDTGTTTLYLAEALSRVSGLTVVTNSSEIARTVAAGEDNEVFLIGGRFVAGASECLGALAVEQADRFRPMHAVITVGAMDCGGISDFSLEEAEMARAMIARARSLTVVADLSKLGRTALYPICPLASVHRLVTGRLPAGDFASAVRAAGIQLIEVGGDDGVI